MRILIIVFVLIFNIQSLSEADDISDFEIEGMSIGDSALDFFTKKKINNSKQNYYNDDEFIPVYIEDRYLFKIYEGVQFHYKKKDQKYKFVAIEGVIIFDDKTTECHDKQEEIFEDLKRMFIKAKIDIHQGKHAQDKTGKSTFKSLELKLKNGNAVSVDCYFWSKEMGYPNNLRISILTKDFLNWIHNKAYN